MMFYFHFLFYLLKLVLSDRDVTPYVTNLNVLAPSLKFNKRPNVLELSLLRVCINDHNFDIMNDQ